MDKVVIEGKYANELSQRYDMMGAHTGGVLSLLGIVSNFRYPLLNGTLLLEYGDKSDIAIDFHLTDDRTGNGSYTMDRGLEWKVAGGAIVLISSPRNPSDRDKLIDSARYFTNLFKAVMLRMTDKTVEVQKDEQRVAKIKKGKVKQGKKNKNRTVYVKQTTYRLVAPAAPPTEDRDKREYERHTLRWTRAGHHRRLRNGEVIWIAEKEIILDPDSVKEDKTYKIIKENKSNRIDNT